MMGLAGSDLQVFVRGEQEAAGDERLAARAQAKEEAERQARDELGKGRLQADIRQRERELEIHHDKEMAILHKEAAAAATNGSVGDSVGTHEKLRSHTQPCCNENTDSTDVYLQRFERYAENQAWGKCNYAVFLNALIKLNQMHFLGLCIFKST